MTDFDNLTEKDFDGHTDFKDLPPEQKLEWLAQLVRMAFEAKKPSKET